MRFKIECWHKFKDVLDQETFIVNAKDRTSALMEAKKKYPRAIRFNIIKQFNHEETNYENARN